MLTLVSHPQSQRSPAEAPFPCVMPECRDRFVSIVEQDAHLALAHGRVFRD